MENNVEVKAPVSWSSHVLIPVAQNVIGGAAVAALAAMGVYGYVGDISSSAGVWCGFAGGVVACAVTVTRFFGDDLGLLATAYREGQRSCDSQIAALELELRAARDAQLSAEADGSQASTERKLVEFQARARVDAIKIISVHFDGDSISRQSMIGRGMGQRDWERAVRLLKAGGVMDGDGVIVARSPGLAVRAIDKCIASTANRGKTFTPAWK